MLPLYYFALLVAPVIQGDLIISSNNANVDLRKNNVRSINFGSDNLPPTFNAQRKSCSFVNGLHTNLIRFITKEGFHRDVGDTLEVTVTNSSIPVKHFVNGECYFVIYSEFKSDVYVDPYEITADPHLRNYVRVLNSWTDLENPAWQAKSNSSVFVQVKAIQTGNLISSDEIKIPIHFRYQKPVSHSMTKQIGLRMEDSESSGGYQPVNLPMPKILLRCAYWNSKQVQDQCNTMKLVCSLKSPKSQKCIWAMVPFKANSKGSTVFIPVGDTDLQGIISFSTILVIIGGTTFLLYNLIRTRQENLASVKPHLN